MKKSVFIIIRRRAVFVSILSIFAITFGLIDYYRETARMSISAINQFKPKVAIIIDDFGQPFNKGREEILALKEYPLTLAVMPNLEKTSEDALRAQECGFDVLIHMPMQPVNGKKSWLGPGVITKYMTSEQITKNLENALKQIPMAVGINNHMGSLVTQRKDLMLPVMKFLKENEMFYIDSRTTEKSVCDTVAKEIGVPFDKCNSFLDDKNDYASIKKEILKLGETARKGGYAIGIGHVGHQGLNTARALKDTLPILKSEGIELVYVSELIQREP